MPFHLSSQFQKEKGKTSHSFPPAPGQPRPNQSQENSPSMDGDNSKHDDAAGEKQGEEKREDGKADAPSPPRDIKKASVIFNLGMYFIYLLDSFILFYN